MGIFLLRRTIARFTPVKRATRKTTRYLAWRDSSRDEGQRIVNCTDSAGGDLWRYAWLLDDRSIERRPKPQVINLDFSHESLLPLLELAKSHVEQLLQQIPAR
jgi:hypothetical protein